MSVIERSNISYSNNNYYWSRNCIKTLMSVYTVIYEYPAGDCGQFSGVYSWAV